MSAQPISGAHAGSASTSSTSSTTSSTPHAPAAPAATPSISRVAQSVFSAPSTEQKDGITQFLSGDYSAEEAAQKAYEFILPAQRDKNNLNLYDKARTILNKALQRFPKDGTLMTMMGMCFLSYEAVDEAEAWARKAKLEAPHTPQTDLLLEDCKRHRILAAAMRRQTMAASRSSAPLERSYTKEQYKNGNNDDDDDQPLAAPAAPAPTAAQNTLFGSSSSQENGPATLSLTENFTAEEASERAYDLIRIAQTDLPNSTKLYSRAHSLLNIALERFAKNSDLMAMKASCLLLLRQHEQATEWAARALSIDPDNATALTVIIDCEDQRSAAPAAPAPPIRVSNPSWSPSTVLPALESILILEKPEDHAADIERLRRVAEAVLQNCPHDDNAFAVKMFCAIIQGNMVEIMGTLETYHLTDKTYELFKNTLPLVENTLRKTPDHSGALALRACCLLFTTLHDHRTTLVNHFMRNQLTPSNVTPELLIDFLTGLHAIGPREPFEAPLIAAEELIKHDPKSRMGLIVKIETLRLLQRFGAAAHCVDLAIAQYPKDDFFWTLRSLCCLAAHDLESAHKAIDQAIELNRKTNILAWVTKLACLSKGKDTDLLMATTLEAMELFPKDQILPVIMNCLASPDKPKTPSSQDADE